MLLWMILEKGSPPDTAHELYNCAVEGGYIRQLLGGRHVLRVLAETREDNEPGQHLSIFQRGRCMDIYMHRFLVRRQVQNKLKVLQRSPFKELDQCLVCQRKGLRGP